jgi:hypothetical protein
MDAVYNFDCACFEDGVLCSKAKLTVLDIDKPEDIFKTGKKR